VVLCVYQTFRMDRDSDRRALIVTGRPRGSELRIAKFVEHLPAFGWRALPVWGPFWLSRGMGVANRLFFHVGLEDFSAVGVPLLVDRAVSLGRVFRPDVVLASCPPFSSVFAGLAVARRLGVPFAIDYRDPWVFNWSRPARLGGWYSRLERRVDSAASFVSLVGDCYVEEYRRVVGAARAVSVPNGFDPSDLSPALAELPIPECVGRYVFAWVGSFRDLGRRAWLGGFLEACRRSSSFGDSAFLLVAGRVPPKVLARLRRLCEGFPVRFVGLLPRDVSRRVMMGADCLLYEGPVGAGRLDLASRLYEFAALGKGVLLFVDRSDSEACRVVSGANMPFLVSSHSISDAAECFLRVFSSPFSANGGSRSVPSWRDSAERLASALSTAAGEVG